MPQGGYRSGRRRSMRKRNYRPMVERNRRAGKEKEERAKQMIDSLLKAGEKICIADLTELCGVSRSFFYKNETVRRTLTEARQLQQDLVPSPKREAKRRQAMPSRALFEKDCEIARLEKENAVLKKKLEKSDLKLLKKL